MTTHELTQRAIEAWNAKGDASVEDRAAAMLDVAFEAAAQVAFRRAQLEFDASNEASAASRRRVADCRQACGETCANIGREIRSMMSDPVLVERIRALSATPSPATGERDARECTCHPDDNPPRPCPRKFALHECRIAAGERDAVLEGQTIARELDDAYHFYRQRPTKDDNPSMSDMTRREATEIADKMKRAADFIEKHIGRTG